MARRYSYNDLLPRLPGMQETRLETYREHTILARRIFPRRRIYRSGGSLAIEEIPRYQVRVVSPKGGELLHLRRADNDDLGAHRANLPFNDAVTQARQRVDGFYRKGAVTGRLVSPLFWGGPMAGAAAGAFMWPINTPAAVAAAIGGMMMMGAPGLTAYKKPQPALKMGGFTWTDNDFCRSFFGTGKTGSGKTESGVKGLIKGVSEGRPDWGGMCFDQKGLFWEELVPMMQAFGREDDLQLLQVRPPNEGSDWVPPAQYNLLSDERIPSRTYAKLVMDTSKRVAGADDPNPFFPQQAMQQIFATIEFFRVARRVLPERFPGPPALHRIYDILSYEHMCRESTDLLRQEARIKTEQDKVDVHRVCQLLELDYLGQPEEQKGGVRATAQLALIPFTTPDAIDVFCPRQNTVDVEDINEGAIFCVSMPQRMEVERLYVAQILTEVGFSQLFRRFDPRASWQKKLTEENIFAFWYDEWQKFANDRHLDTDRSRQAKGTVIAFTQGHGSPLVALSEDKLRVGLSNMANRIHGRAADDYDAQETAKFFPQVRRIVRVRPGKDGKEFREVPKYDPNTILKTMGKFEVILAHCEKGDRRMVLHPTGSDAKRPKWYPSYLVTFGNLLLKIGLYRTLARLHFSGEARASKGPIGIGLEDVPEVSKQFAHLKEAGINRSLTSGSDVNAWQSQIRNETSLTKPPVSDLPGADKPIPPTVSPRLPQAGDGERARRNMTARQQANDADWAAYEAEEEAKRRRQLAGQY